MEPADQADADGTVHVDTMWKRKIMKLMKETPLASSLLDAVGPLVSLLGGAVELEDFEDIINDKRREWKELLYTDAGFGLPRSYSFDFAIAIYVYTLETVSVYKTVNRAMFNPDRRNGGGGVSDELLCCMPYIKFLDAALEALPNSYVYRGEVRRGVKWVYPSPDRHDPKGYFRAGATVMWYEFKSTSKEEEVMTRPHFCGVDAGPRSIFVVTACRGYDIEKFTGL